MKKYLLPMTLCAVVCAASTGYATMWTGGGAQFPDGSYVWTNKTNWGGSNAPLNSGGVAEFPENCEVTVNLDGVFTQNNGEWGNMKQIIVPATSHVTFVGNARGTSSYVSLSNASAVRRLTLANGARITTSSAFPASASIIVTNGAMLTLGGTGYSVASNVQISVSDNSRITGTIGNMIGGATIRVDHSQYSGLIKKIENGMISLENGSVGTLTGLALGTNGTFRLAGGSSVSATGTFYTKDTGGHFVLSGRSTLTVESYFQTGLQTTFDIDDSTVISETQTLTLCNGSGDTGGDTFTFRGDNPQLIVKKGISIKNAASVGANGAIFNFEVPEGGFIEAPVYDVSTGKTFGNPTNIKPDGVNAKFIHVNLLASSPALDPDYAYATLSKLLFSASGLQNTAFFNCTIDGADNQASFAFTTSDGETAASSPANVRYIVARMQNGAGNKEVRFRGVTESSGVAGNTTISASRLALTLSSAATALADTPLKTYAVLYAGESSSSMSAVSERQIPEPGAFSMTWSGSVYAKTYYLRLALETRTAGGETTYTEWSPVMSAATLASTTYTWRDVNGDWTGDWGDNAHWSNNKNGDCLGHPASVDANVYIPAGHPVVINLDAAYKVGKFYATGANTSLRLTVPAGMRDVNKLATYYSHLSNYSSFGGTNNLIVFDGVNANLGSLKVSLGKDSSLVFSNSAWCTTYQVTVNNPGAWVRILGGSTVGGFGATPSCVLGASTTAEPCGIVVDDSTYGLTNSLQLTSGASSVTMGSFTIRGRRGRVVIPSQNQDMTIYSESIYPNDHRFIFDVPAGGFAYTPLRVTATSTKQAAFYQNKTGAQIGVIFEVTRDSGIFDSGEKADYPLFTSTTGINRQFVTFARPKHVRSGNAFLYGTATASPHGWALVTDFSGTAKAIGLRVTPPPGTVLMVQ